MHIEYKIISSLSELKIIKEKAYRMNPKNRKYTIVYCECFLCLNDTNFLVIEK